MCLLPENCKVRVIAYCWQLYTLCTLRSDSPTIVDLLHRVPNEAVVQRELKDVRPLAELASSDVAGSEDSRLQRAADWRCVLQHKLTLQETLNMLREYSHRSVMVCILYTL